MKQGKNPVRAILLSIAVAASMTGFARAADLVVAMPNWPSGQATANIIKVALAEYLGIEADAEITGTLTAFNGLNNGTIDIHPEVWLPNLESLVNKYGGENGTVLLAKKGVEATQGLCTTRETAETFGIADIKDLNDPKKTAVLDTDGDGRGELWIGAPTWSSTGIERVRANSYGYGEKMTLVETPEDVAMAAVDAAIATGRPVVFFCYSPHHVFNLHDIVHISEPAYDASKWNIISLADDPAWIAKSSAPVAWDKAHFHIAYSSKLAKENPKVAEFLERIDFTPEEITGMSYSLQVDREDPYEFAKNWVATHSERVKGWTK